MLDMNKIRSFFPDSISDQPESMLREYLQCKVLEIIFQEKISDKLIFIGGTAIRLIYDSQRFSEDLDFDNKGLSLDDWIELGQAIQIGLSRQGFNLDIAKTRLNDTFFHHNLRFLDILYQYELSPHKNSVLLIKTDSQDQEIQYQHEVVKLNKFDIDCRIKVMPRDIALSQKFRAFFDREMGRDLFDISSLAPSTKPNYDYLEQALGIKNPQELKTRVLERCQEFNFKDLITRTKPFLFSESKISRILDFQEYMQQYEF